MAPNKSDVKILAERLEINWISGISKAKQAVNTVDTSKPGTDSSEMRPSDLKNIEIMLIVFLQKNAFLKVHKIESLLFVVYG